MTLDAKTLIPIMTFALFVLGTLLTVIGYYAKQFIEKVTTALTELIKAVKELQTITAERNIHNSEMHEQFRKQLDEHDKLLDAHGISLERHEVELKYLKNEKGTHRSQS